MLIALVKPSEGAALGIPPASRKRCDRHSDYPPELRCVKFCQTSGAIDG